MWIDMSRAFVSEDRGLEQLQVAPRAVLPAGAPNWVTPGGFRLLELEHEKLGADIRNEKDVAQLTALRQMQAELEYRLASAQIIDLASRPPAEIRFGATVRLRSEDTEQELKIVGADEADAATGLLSIHSPLARALLGKLPGQAVILHTDEGEEITTGIVDVRYDTDKHAPA
ncbi:MAG: GreA/GreB family elongation factor [Verrucomicrobiaceae bacterium]|nr:GreA/GreB family elongation factor [Verrucomicrobiaceae bacterium]